MVSALLFLCGLFSTQHPAHITLTLQMFQRLLSYLRKSQSSYIGLHSGCDLIPYSFSDNALFQLSLLFTVLMAHWSCCSLIRSNTLLRQALLSVSSIWHVLHTWFTPFLFQVSQSLLK